MSFQKTDEVIDEDIEALLYAQVYYGKSDHTDLPIDQQNDSLNQEVLVDSINGENKTDPILSQEESPGVKLNLEELDNSDEDDLADQDSSLVDSEITENSSDNSSQPDILDARPFNHDQKLIDGDVQQQQYIEISTSSASINPCKNSPSEIFAHNPLLGAPHNPTNQPLLNNITINQYIYFNQQFQKRLNSYRKRIIWSKRCQKDLNLLQKGLLDEKIFFKNLNRRLRGQKKQRKHIRREFLTRQQNAAADEVICLSDSDNSDVQFLGIEAVPERLDKDKTMKTVVNSKSTATEATTVEGSSDDENEIIYVAPPPVPIVHIADSDSDKETPLQDIDEASNDFLAPTATCENFNFSLHGSEFQDAEFLRPANPVDTYETESSTSTSDFNRDSSREFSNTVNTIVFSEVDFPREDIFEGSNLETFGELITPKRNRKVTEDKEERTKEAKIPKGPKKTNPKALSESSSESDYDASDFHRNLPDLSPMVCPGLSRGNSGRNKTKSAKNINTNKELDKGSKGSKCSSFLEDSNGIVDTEETESMVCKKSKKRNSDVISQDAPKGTKKRKKKSGNKVPEEVERSTKDSTILTPSDDDISDLTSDHSESAPKKKNKKKMKQARHTMDIGDDDTSIGAETRSRKKSKKRTPSRKTVGKSGNMDNIIEKEILESTSKKKSKKRKQSSPSDSKVTTDNEDLSSNQDDNIIRDPQAITHENDDNQRKDKKKKCIEDKEKRVILGNLDRKDTKKTRMGSNKSSTDDRENDKNKEEIHENAENCKAPTPEIVDSQKIDKRKKRASSNRSSVEEQDNVKNIDQTKSNETAEEGKILNLPVTYETQKSEQVVIEHQVDEDIVLIEKAIPIHTIDSETDDDVISVDGPDLELANITTITSVATEEPDKFDVKYIQSLMSDDPEKWKILPADRYMSVTKKGPRCNKCRQFGHIAFRCPNKSNIPVCTLCGQEGHEEPRCPNKVCFTCATPGSYSTVFCRKCAHYRNMKCVICHQQGHSEKTCPDLWRRYFMTTKDGVLVKPRKFVDTLKPPSERWCSGCAENGHFEFECNSYKWIREYPNSTFNVCDYRNAYNNDYRSTYDKRANRQKDRKKLVQKGMSDAELDSNTLGLTIDGNIQLPSGEANNVIEQSEILPESLDTIAPTEHPPGDSLRQHETTNDKPSEQENVEARQLELSVEAEERLRESQRQSSLQLVSPPTEARYCTRSQQPLTRRKDKQRHRHARFNPFSVVNEPGERQFTPYQSVLNPCSVLRNPDRNDRIGPPGFIDRVGLTAAPTPLFNRVTNATLEQQISNLLSQEYRKLREVNQGMGQNNFIQNDFYQGSQYQSQVPLNQMNFYPTQTTSYMDFSNDIPGQEYYDFSQPQVYNPNSFMNSPFTITNDSSREIDYRGQNRLYDSGRRSGDTLSLRQPNFIPLTPGPRDSANVDTYKPTELNNVEDNTAKKFVTSSVKELNELIGSEIEKLNNIKNLDSKMYKKKFNNIEQLQKIEIKTNAVKKQMYFLYKHINMFLFGKQKLYEGKKYLNVLQNFVYNPGNNLNDAKRSTLLEAYGYVFGGEHPHFDYRKHLNSPVGLRYGK